jgi:hypothetical protein
MTILSDLLLRKRFSYQGRVETRECWLTVTVTPKAGGPELFRAVYWIDFLLLNAKKQGRV